MELTLKIYTVKIVHKDFHILSRECFTTDKEAEAQGEHMVKQYNSSMGQSNEVFYIDVHEHIVIRGGESNKVTTKRKDLIL